MTGLGSDPGQGAPRTLTLQTLGPTDTLRRRRTASQTIEKVLPRGPPGLLGNQLLGPSSVTYVRMPGWHLLRVRFRRPTGTPISLTSASGDQEKLGHTRRAPGRIDARFPDEV
jgi:hypothetical protein